MKTLIKFIVWFLIMPMFFYKLGVQNEQKNAKPVEQINCETKSVQEDEQTVPQKLQEVTEFTGKVSFYTNEYCEKFNSDCITASGDRFDDSKFTAACSDIFELGDKVAVSYNDGVGFNIVTVTCNDRGSFSEKYGRIMDLSKEAFSQLAPLSEGVINVQVWKVI